MHGQPHIRFGINKFHRMWRCVVGWLVSDVSKDGRTCIFKGSELMSGTVIFFLSWPYSPSGPRHPHYRVFLIILRHTTLGRTLDGWSARRRDLNQTTHNTHKRQTPMPPAGFEPTISASERPQTHPLDRNFHFQSKFVFFFNAEGRLIIAVKQLISDYSLRYITLHSTCQKIE